MGRRRPRRLAGSTAGEGRPRPGVELQVVDGDAGEDEADESEAGMEQTDQPERHRQPLVDEHPGARSPRQAAEKEAAPDQQAVDGQDQHADDHHDGAGAGAGEPVRGGRQRRRRRRGGGR